MKSYDDNLTALRRKGAPAQCHGERSLYDHLNATYGVLSNWRQPDRVRLAGLMHSVYSTDVFGPALFARTERDEVRSLVGTDAESLVHLYCSIRRADFFRTVEVFSLSPGHRLLLSSRHDDRMVALSHQQIGDLIVLYMANTAEQAQEVDRAPSQWLGRTARLSALASRYTEQLPPVFDSCTAAVGIGPEKNLLAVYSQFTSGPCSPLPTRQLASALGEVPWVAEPFVVLALATAAEGDLLTAGELATHGETLLRQWGVPWDKRLSHSSWLNLVALVQEVCAARGRHAGVLAARLRNTWTECGGSPVRLHRSMSSWAGPPASLTRTVSTVDTTGLTGASVKSDRGSSMAQIPGRFTRLVERIGTQANRLTIREYPELPTRPWYDPQQFALVNALESAAPQIAEEFRGLEESWFAQEAEPILRTGNWRVLFLYQRGQRDDENCRRCPVTSQIVERHRTVRSGAGSIYFSQLDPGTYIAPHRGPTNLRVRCHLGLEVPPGCGLRVQGIVGQWEQARCITFSDRFLHEAWNWSTRRRVVLVVDLWHPNLSDHEIQLIEGLYRYAESSWSPFSQYWDSRECQPVPPVAPRYEPDTYSDLDPPTALEVGLSRLDDVDRRLALRRRSDILAQLAVPV
jgi:hypothetical protein